MAYGPDTGHLFRSLRRILLLLKYTFIIRTPKALHYKFDRPQNFSSQLYIPYS